nr:ROK family transcriptional regulator [Actinopolymorpha pittospori]
MAVSFGRGSNLPAIGSYNQAVVLDAIRRARGGLSRVEIAQRTGLTAQTVGNVSRKLLQEGLIRESGRVINGPGKPRQMLQLRPAGRFAVGVHVDPAVITLVLANLEGSVVAHSRYRTPSSSRPNEVVDLIARRTRELVRGADVVPERLLGLGVAVPGPIDVEAGVVLDPPLLPLWRDVPLRQVLTEATGLPVLVDKDAIAAVVGELWLGAGADDRRKERTGVAFVYYGAGLAAGLVVNGETVRGKGSVAGNIGHITVDDRGPTCSCGRVGCLGMLVTPQGLVLEAIARGVLPSPAAPVDEKADMKSVERPFMRLARLAERGDVAAREVLRQAGVRLARAVVVLANLLDMDDFVFGGPFWRPISAQLLDSVREAVLTSTALVPKQAMHLVDTRIGEDVAAVGGACLVLDAAVTPRPAAMLISAKGSSGALAL